MRDRLVHHYFDINLDVLWQTITEDLPQMLAALPSEDELDRRASPLNRGTGGNGLGDEPQHNSDANDDRARRRATRRGW